MSKLLKSIHARIENRADLRPFRTDVLHSLLPQKIEKRAFDTRRTNQYTDYNPRRSVQYYHRSDSFITRPLADTIKTLFKLKTAADSVKEDFVGDPDFFDSYARILCNAIDKTLRVDQKDFDYSQPQFDYLNELLYLRYRLRYEDIEKLGEKDLRNVILDRDEKLLYKQIYAAVNNGGLQKTGKPEIVLQKQEDTLIEKLFGGVKATASNKEVSRSVTITINDKIVDDMKKEG